MSGLVLAVVLLSIIAATTHALAQMPDLSGDSDKIADAESESPRPESARRFVRKFDFEDPDNPDPVPFGWLRAQEDPRLVPDPSGKKDKDGRPLLKPRSPRPGFPAHNEAAYDHKQAYSGRASIKIPVHGGSASLRLQPGELPIYADADYAVTAHVKTSGLLNARAFLTVRLLDVALKPITASQVRSEELWDYNASQWTEVTVEMPAKFPGAAWMQIDLEVLQPKEFSQHSELGEHVVLREDLDGSAWFDDVLVYLQPRAAMVCLEPMNVAIGGKGPTLEASVRDLGGDELAVRITILDLNSRVVASTNFMVDPAGTPVRYQPELPGFGFYRAILEVDAETDEQQASPAVRFAESGQKRAGTQIRVAKTELNMVWLPTDEQLQVHDVQERISSNLAGATSGRPGVRHRFGVAFSDQDFGRLDLSTAASERLGAGFAILPIFDPQTPLENVREDLKAKAPLIHEMLSQGMDLTLSLQRSPMDLTRRRVLDPNDPLAMMALAPNEWFGYLQPILDQFGQQVLRYQVGATGTDRVFWHANLAKDLSRFEEQISTLVPGPMMTLAWRADLERIAIERPTVSEAAPSNALDAMAKKRKETRQPRGPLVDALTLTYPKEFAHDQIPRVLDAWLAPDDAGQIPEITLIFENLDFGSSTPRERVRELSKRMISAWMRLGEIGSHQPGDMLPRIGISSPWSIKNAASATAQLEPTECWPVMANVSRLLAGRRVLGRYPADPGITCLILSEGDPAKGDVTRGALVAWQDGPLRDTVNEHGGSDAEPERAVVNVSALAENVHVIDIFGNRRGLTPAEMSDGVGIGDVPVFIEGIDPHMALFVAGIQISRFVELIVAENEHAVMIKNPWPLNISGSIQIRDPEAIARNQKIEEESKANSARARTWEIAPAGIVDFAIAPLENYKIPMQFNFRPSQLAGPKKLQILVRVHADREYPLVKLNTTLELGLKDYQLDLEAQRAPGPNGSDVLITATVTNTGSLTRTLLLQAATANFATQQLQISDLSPGETVIKRFVFKNAGAALAKRQVLVSASDLEEAKRINKAVTVP